MTVLQQFWKFENGCTWTVENAWILPNGFAKADDGCSEILCEHAMIRVDSQKRGVEFFDDQKQYTPNICFIQNHNGRAIGFGIDPLNDLWIAFSMISRLSQI